MSSFIKSKPMDLHVELTNFTVIRVKRKLISEPNSDSDSAFRYQSFKRLRHIGSFTRAPTEEQLEKSSLLNQIAKNNPSGSSGGLKRVRFSDLNSEQFLAYAEKLEGDGKKVKTVDVVDGKDETENNKENQENDLFNIALTENDLPQDDNNNREESSQIACNGQVLEVLPSAQSTDYVYDYYVLMDNLIDFEEPEQNFADDYADADSNDENYRYNDYPDEDEFGSDSEDDSERSNFGSSTNADGDDEDDCGTRYGYGDYDDDDEDREYYDEDEEDLCKAFNREMTLQSLLDRKKKDEDEEEEDDDDDD